MPDADPVANWAPAASRDVDDIWDYYATAASLETALRLVTSIVEAANRIAAHPLRGRSRSDLRPDLRSVRAPPFVVFYKTEPRGVEVVRVLHERRDLPGALDEEDIGQV